MEEPDPSGWTRESNFLVIKIFNGIIRSAQKRPVSSRRNRRSVNRIEQGSQPSDNEINSEYIGSLVMDELNLDEVCVRLLVFTGFQDVGELEKPLETNYEETRRKE